MPVRSLSSPVLKWPDLHAVDEAVRRWAKKAVQDPPHGGDILSIGYFGSYARGDWGVGSDLDLIVIVSACHEPFERRAAQWDVVDLPVSVNLLVYTQQEWESLDPHSRFRQTLSREAVWVYMRPSEPES